MAESDKFTKATITIIETFTKIRELSRTIKKLPNVTDKKEQQPLMQKSREIIAEILDDSLETDESETTIELNLAVLKFILEGNKNENSYNRKNRSLI